ncbi:2,3-bisphosphoglycerate-independent phosphoglycerate mutase [bacterium]|nr:2,3-bisphosphoglycerate-independent phosphoglycerate mutase [bacterium]MBU1638800.1 2,3-bisphosphoglycerate-independent phosphoglycerate mutase [bacterium]MBU1919940.1 2,3-bisphosphoglycerate-independent phosphoglycerate mutase [bacterium]
MSQRVILTVLDGYGLAPPGKYNAVTEANTPFLDKMWNTNPTVTLKTCGLDVGLPLGQMGNSEVGHLNIGAGRVVFQDVTRIDKAIEEGAFFEIQVLKDLIADLKKRKRRLHLLGLVSTGGVHAAMNHLRAILILCRRLDFHDVVLHAFTDGRDTPPHSALSYLQSVHAWMTELEVGRIATVIGRYWAMDRDKRWQRIEKAYRAICDGIGLSFKNVSDAVADSYDREITDEFIEPSIIGRSDEVSRLSSEDGVLFFNFRADRTRQLTDALTDPNFDGFDAQVKVKRYVTMTRYREDYKFPILFPPVQLDNILGGIVSEAGLRQLRIAETEKYPHVTFFFNGGIDTPFPGEDRILVPSPKVATYNLMPEMSAYEVADKLCAAIESKTYDLIVINFANCDMVGHSGILEAAIQAVETVDKCVQKMCAAAAENKYTILITADHGNAEQMWDDATSGPFTAHTTNEVPLALIGDSHHRTLRKGGRLADLAPTVLELMDLHKPKEMTGDSLLQL